MTQHETNEILHVSLVHIDLPFAHQNVIKTAYWQHLWFNRLLKNQFGLTYKRLHLCLGRHLKSVNFFHHLGGGVSEPFCERLWWISADIPQLIG